MHLDVTGRAPRTLLGLTGYQWTVFLAAWLGWGFDIFDGLLFNYVAPNCVPTLLHLPLGSAEAKSATLFWVGLLSSLLLVGWAVGGILFGKLADRIGRSRTLLATMLLYALGTAACAAAPNMTVLVVCRILASLGIGGEWAAGAAMVAEVVPEKRRVEMGALLYTSAPFGLFLATWVNFQLAGVAFSAHPELSWRYVFLAGLIPAAVAFVFRAFVKEPERWTQTAAAQASPPRIAELFEPGLRKATVGGFLMALTALITWWSCNVFIPVIATGLAREAASARGVAAAAMFPLIEHWKALATSYFNVGGLIGTLLTVPAAKRLGRRSMFAIYFVACALSIFAAYGLPLAPDIRLYFYFPIGLSVFGVFGSFTYYLPELFPTRLRGTGSGFCYNTGRILAAVGPFAVGAFLARSHGDLSVVLRTLAWVGVVPVLGLLALPFVQETRGLTLAD